MYKDLRLVQGLDYRAPANPASCIGDLAFVFTSDHTNTEIGLDTGDMTRCNSRVRTRLGSHISPEEPLNPMANKAHSVDAPVARLLYIVHPWRRATDAQRWA